MAFYENDYGAFRERPPYYRSLAPLIHWMQGPRPFDWPAEFGREAPLCLEIGHGNGEALVRRARAFTDWDHVGLEIAWESTKRTLRRVDKERLTNVRLIQTEAHLGLERMFGPESIDQAIALFPVPWPKDRHAKRRLFSTEFLTLLSSRLRAGGLARIVTDFEPLRDWILEQVPGSGLAARDRTVDARENTKYERKWLESGQSAFFEIHLAKETHIAVPAPEEPSVQVYRFESFDPARFVPQNQVGTVTIKFFDQVYDPIRKIVLVRAFISEGRLVQELWIKIEPEGGGWRLGPAGKLNVVPTQGVMRALEIAFEACR